MDEEERKFANELHYAVKGFLIHPHYSDETVRQIKDSYLKRLWGNHERMVYCREGFEKSMGRTCDKNVTLSQKNEKNAQNRKITVYIRYELV